MVTRACFRGLPSRRPGGIVPGAIRRRSLRRCLPARLPRQRPCPVPSLASILISAPRPSVMVRDLPAGFGAVSGRGRGLLRVDRGGPWRERHRQAEEERRPEDDPAEEPGRSGGGGGSRSIHGDSRRRIIRSVGCGHQGVRIQLSAVRSPSGLRAIIPERARPPRNSVPRADFVQFSRAAPPGAVTIVLPGARLTTKLRRPMHPDAAAHAARRALRAFVVLVFAFSAGFARARRRPPTMRSRSISSTPTSRPSSRRSPRSPGAIS